MNYVITPASVIFTTEAGDSLTVPSGNDLYNPLVEALLAGDEARANELAASANQATTLIGEFGKVAVYGGHVTFDGLELNDYMSQKILAATNKEPFARFLDNVMLNPSRRAVQDLFKWIEKARLPITEDGHLIGYKYVRWDYKDQYSGTFDNSVGAICEMPRNEVNDDFGVSCSTGLHFCSLDYLNTSKTNRRLMIVKINPRDVVAFPDQYHLTKARCCRYEVIHEIEWSQAKDYFMDSDGVFVPPTFEPQLEEGFYILNAAGRFFLPIGEGLTDDPDLAEVFPPGYQVSSTCATIPVPQLDTVLQRLSKVETHLNLPAADTIAGRLDAISKALNVALVPITAFLDRAESQLSLS